MKITIKPKKKRTIVIAEEPEYDLESDDEPPDTPKPKIRLKKPDKPQEEPRPKGYTCICGKFHKFTPWVYSNWWMRIKAECPECGYDTNLISGKVIPVGDRPVKTLTKKKHEDTDEDDE